MMNCSRDKSYDSRDNFQFNQPLSHRGVLEGFPDEEPLSLFRGHLKNNLGKVSKILQVIKKKMQTAQLRNLIMRAVVDYEDRGKAPQGRRRKLSLAYILDRIFYVCKTGCQWSQLDVSESSYKTVYHYFNLWSKAHIFENVFYATVNARTLQEGPLAPPGRPCWRKVRCQRMSTSSTIFVVNYCTHNEITELRSLHLLLNNL